MSEERHRLELEAPPETALAAVAAVAEEWGAEWLPAGAGGRLHLPVVAGLRRGVMAGRLEVRGVAGGGSRVTLDSEATHWRVHRSAAAVLVLGLVGALPVMLWPLDEQFLALAPIGLVLMFLAWFMVVSRLRSAGAAEFLEAVGELLSGEDGG